MGFLSKLFAPFSSSANIVQDGETRWWGGNSWAVGASETHAGEAVNQSSLLTSATCYACTKALAETFSGLPGEVFRDLGERKELDKKTFAFELLTEQPNPEMDAFTFWELCITRLVNRGNFWAEIQRNERDEPVALWPISNDRVEPMRDADGSLYWQIESDYAGSPHFEDPSWRRQHLTYLSPHNMLNVVGFGSQSGITAPGMLPGSQEIAVDFAARRYGAGFFGSGAMPSGIVEHPGFIANEGQRNQFRTDLNAIHSNKNGAHKLGVLWQGATYKQIAVTPDQAQFLETRQFTSRQLCKFYGVPPAIIGDYEDSKFATADAMIRAFVMITLRNLVVRVEKAINRQILNVRDADGRMRKAFTKPMIYELALKSLLRGDPKSQAETWQIMRTSGAATANEWRGDVGMNPIPGKEGDYLIVNGGMARLDQIDNQGDRAKNAEEGAEKVPAFDKEALISAIEESGLLPEKTQVRGYDVPLKEAIAELMTEAVVRIHSIATTQFDRWREKDPKEVAEKLPDFWAKQEARLLNALAICDKVAMKMNPNACIANAITKSYIGHYTSLDHYDVFDADKIALDLDTLKGVVGDELAGN